MSRTDIPTRVPIQTDTEEGFGHRFWSIESAQNALETSSRTEAVVQSCEFVAHLTDVLEELSPEQAEWVAEELSGSGLEVNYQSPIAEIQNSN